MEQFKASPFTYGIMALDYVLMVGGGYYLSTGNLIVGAAFWISGMFIYRFGFRSLVADLYAFIKAQETKDHDSPSA